MRLSKLTIYMACSLFGPACFSAAIKASDKAGHITSWQQHRDEHQAARVEYEKLASQNDVPPHHQWEAAENLKIIGRLENGLPIYEPAANRTQMPKLPKPGLMLYVAPNGSDTNPGTIKRPFATLERARDEIRSFKERGNWPAGGATIYIRGGEYAVRKTFELTTRDSGTENAPLVFRAYENEKPVFRGGIRLNNFKPVQDPTVLDRLPAEARGKVQYADLKTHGISQLRPFALGGFSSGRGFKTHPAYELFYNNEPMPFSRWPNDGFMRVADVLPQETQPTGGKANKSGKIMYDGDRPGRWLQEIDVWLYGYWYHGWADSYEKVAAIDPEKRIITLAPPLHNYGFKKGAPFYALNLLCEIDQPGEWYLDRENSILYFYPPSTPSKATIEMSLFDAPMVVISNASHIRLQGLTWELGCADGLIIKGGSHCLVAGCTVRHMAGNGIEISGGDNHGILSCDIYSMGRAGTLISGGNRRTLTPAGHFIENCHVYNLSRIDHTYTPAVVMSGVGNRIAHNLFHDIRSSAIRLGGNDHIVEFNEIHHVVTESDDQGGADMWGNPTYRGNIYRYNYWHHIGNQVNCNQAPDCGQAGIRLDDAISGTLIYGNIFQKCSAGKLGFGGVQIHGGKENILDNNIFIDCMAAVSFSHWGEKRWAEFTANSMSSKEIDPALYISRYPALARLGEDADKNFLWRNLVINCGQFVLRSRGKEEQIDNYITSETAGFFDASGKLRIPKEHPLFNRLSFQPIPFDDIGLYKDEFRH